MSTRNAIVQICTNQEIYKNCIDRSLKIKSIIDTRETTYCRI